MATLSENQNANTIEQSRPTTILLVEDEDFVRNVTREVLELAGHNVLEAIDAESGLQLFNENIEIIDLLLTDVVMPGMNGREFAGRLLAIQPNLKVIFMSGYTDNAVVREGLSSPHLNYLQKPFTLDGLIEKVDGVLSTPTRDILGIPKALPLLASPLQA